MANLPIEFNTIDVVKNNTLHLSYVFDVIDNVEANEENLPIKQDFQIKGIHVNLSGKTSNPNISVSIDGTTHLFTLNNAYITDKYPHLKEDVLDCAFVIEGYSIVNIKKERVLIFLPMKKTTLTTNVFYPLEQAIVNKGPIKGLTFNDYIPHSTLEKDSYTYYSHTDNDGFFYHVLYFKTSPLEYTLALTIPKNDEGYKSEYKIVQYKSASLAKQHDNISSQFEDNIYIDCVPVELENQKITKFMNFTKDAGSIYVDILLYIVYIVILTIIVYGIYYIYIYSSKS
jgi:hypothetical protein